MLEIEPPKNKYCEGPRKGSCRRNAGHHRVEPADQGKTLCHGVRKVPTLVYTQSAHADTTGINCISKSFEHRPPTVARCLRAAPTAQGLRGTHTRLRDEAQSSCTRGHGALGNTFQCNTILLFEMIKRCCDAMLLECVVAYMLTFGTEPHLLTLPTGSVLI